MKKTLYFNAGIVVWLLVTGSTNFGYHMVPDDTVNMTQLLAKNPNATQPIVCSAINQIDYTSDCVNILNRAIIPCILVFVLNVLSMQKMAERAKKFKDPKGDKSSKFVTSVIGMNIVFLVIYLPWGVIFFTHHTANYALNDPASLDADDFVNLFSFQIIYSVSDCISYLNNMTPFFLSMMYNAIFKREILSMIAFGKRVGDSTTATLSNSIAVSAMPKMPILH